MTKETMQPSRASTEAAIAAAEAKLAQARASIPTLTEQRRASLLASNDVAVDHAEAEIAVAKAAITRETERLELLRADLAAIENAEQQEREQEKQAHLQDVFAVQTGLLETYAARAHAVAETVAQIQALGVYLARNGGPSLVQLRSTPARSVEAQYGEERLVPITGPRILDEHGNDTSGGSGRSFAAAQPLIKERPLLVAAHFIPGVVLPNLEDAVSLPACLPGESEIWGSSVRADVQKRYAEIVAALLAPPTDTRA